MILCHNHHYVTPQYAQSWRALPLTTPYGSGHPVGPRLLPPCGRVIIHARAPPNTMRASAAWRSREHQSRNNDRAAYESSPAAERRHHRQIPTSRKRRWPRSRNNQRKEGIFFSYIVLSKEKVTVYLRPLESNQTYIVRFVYLICQSS